MEYILHPERVLFARDPMLYGHFLEHFHRQIYGGVYDPSSPFADADGFREDVLSALRGIRTPIIRWPGGCFVSAYHWQDGVGPARTPTFDKAWRVEEPNAFGTDEFLLLCKKLGCAPYICTNAGTGGAEEMSDWVEYCNLQSEGKFARRRIENGHMAPYGVRYWSVGNENWGAHEIGAWDSADWSRIVTEAAKMMRRVDPTIELSAAALADIDWNVRLLKAAGPYLRWISIHGYWDGLWQEESPASYAECMAFTADLERDVRKVRGTLMALGLEKRIRIAYDEWNLRGWHHPNIHTIEQAIDPADYLAPRDRNDENATYTMADAVFSACFLNMCLRNADIIGMANFAPAVNTRGAIFTHADGIVLRPTYHVFALYAGEMGDQVIDLQAIGECPYRVVDKGGAPIAVDQLDLLATRDSASGDIAIALVNKHAQETAAITLRAAGHANAARMQTLSGASPDDYNDIGRNSVRPHENNGSIERTADALHITLPPHSVNILRIDHK